MMRRFALSALLLAGSIFAAPLTLTFDDPNCADWTQTGLTFYCSSATTSSSSSTTTTTTTSSTTSTTLPSGAIVLSFDQLKPGTAGSQQRLTTAGLNKQIVVGSFNSGSGQGMGSIAWGPYTGYSQAAKLIVLSTAAGDVDPHSATALASQTGTNGTLYYFTVQAYPGYPTVANNVQLFANMKIPDCPSGQKCDIFEEIARPGP
jgi:opacity protein-like surface antigen